MVFVLAGHLAVFGVYEVSSARRNLRLVSWLVSGPRSAEIRPRLLTIHIGLVTSNVLRGLGRSIHRLFFMFSNFFHQVREVSFEDPLGRDRCLRVVNFLKCRGTSPRTFTIMARWDIAI